MYCTHVVPEAEAGRSAQRVTQAEERYCTAIYSKHLEPEAEAGTETPGEEEGEKDVRDGRDSETEGVGGRTVPLIASQAYLNVTK